MLTYTTLKDRPRDFLAATGLTPEGFCVCCQRLSRPLPLVILWAKPGKAKYANGSWAVAPKGLLSQMKNRLTFYPRLSEDQSPANHARLALWAEPTPDALLDSSLAARLATGLSRARHGPGTRCQPGGHESPHAGGSPRGGPGRDRAAPPTPDGCRATNRALQREEESAHG